MGKKKSENEALMSADSLLQLQAEAQNLLKDYKLSVTASRLKILELFIHHKGALAHGDIEKKTGEKFDRVTIYRTLQTFLEKGLIHHIPTTENAVLYALCKDNCKGGHHHDNHVHFICDECKTTICLEDITIPEVKLPKGFKPSNAEMVVNGVCESCLSGT
jgi:Fur family ferric uptake transcriptional regulator